MRAFERLIAYSKYPSASCEENDCCPSTVSQLDFGKALVDEMLKIGITDARITENGYVYGSIPATVSHECPVIGFISHMDVVSDVPYTDIKAHLVENYDGGELLLSEETGITMSPEEFNSLSCYVGKSLVVTDGTTLLGADDKAGIAEILTAAEKIIADPSIPHGKICIAFTPDEEIGRGADLFDVPGFGADFAYTLDGGGFGEVEYETFNASAAKITVNGRNIHPGAAKNKMKNAIIIGNELLSLLPHEQRPEHTENYDGFFHVTSFEGSVEHASISIILRDHNLDILRKREDTVRAVVSFLNGRYGEGTVVAEIKEQYRNMAEKILPHYHLIETAFEAIEELGGEPVSLPVRGGTDGSRLSYMGLPCPNLGTGSHNHHGKFEYAVAEEMDKCVDTIILIAKKYATRKI